MAYTPTVWANGDVITATKLNKAENGIAAAYPLVVTISSDAFDKTFAEVLAAFPNVVVQDSIPDTVDLYYAITGLTIASGAYTVIIGEQAYVTDAEDGYPTLNNQ